jgi:hypothetical protein
MKLLKVTSAAIALSAWMLMATMFAGDIGLLSDPKSAASERPLIDLTLTNFFSAGWNEAWQKMPHPDGAPDLTLLRVQSNLLLRSLRTDYFYERQLKSSGERDVQFVNQLVEYPFNRRLMLAVFGNYAWVDVLGDDDREGTSYGALARFQLIDTPRTSYALNLRVAAPNHALGETLTTSSVSLAGWHDLTPLGLDRVGLYWHVQGETFTGPHALVAKQNDLTYAVSLAKTWTSPSAPLGNLSTFFETFARTDLDGPRSGKTLVTLTPGLRFTVAHHHVFMAGLEIPVTEPRPYEQIVRVTYILSF